jgi:hypothetical protein
MKISGHTSSLRVRFILAIGIALIITMGAGMTFTILSARKSQLEALNKKVRVLPFF